MSLNDYAVFRAPHLKRDPLGTRTVMVTKTLAVALLVIATPLHAQSVGRTYAHWNLPRWATAALHKGDFAQRYALFYDLNPYYQRGDFDGDGQLDIAVQITEKKSGKRGIAIVHHTDQSVHVLGAGVALGNGGDDFSWLWVWRVESPEHLRGRLGPRREALLVEKPESASGWIVWDGRQYNWIQGGD